MDARMQGASNKYPLGTTMRPRLAVKLTDEHIFWAGLNHFRCDFWSDLCYGEKSSFLSLFTKALPSDRWTDGRTQPHLVLKIPFRVEDHGLETPNFACPQPGSLQVATHSLNCKRNELLSNNKCRSCLYSYLYFIKIDF